MQVLFGRVLGKPGELFSQAVAESVEHGCDGDLVITHAQARGHVAGVDPGDVGRIGRWHHHRAHLVGAQGVHGHGQHQR